MTSTIKKAARKTNATGKTFSEFERTAIQERARELAADKTDGEKAVLAKITGMPEPDRSMAKRIHALVKAAAPDLKSRTWYGMPAYTKDDKVICYFQSGQKYKSRYCTFGFQDAANLDEGSMWPTSFALKDLTAAEEAKIAALVKKAVKK